MGFLSTNLITARFIFISLITNKFPRKFRKFLCYIMILKCILRKKDFRSPENISENCVVGNAARSDL